MAKVSVEIDISPEMIEQIMAITGADTFDEAVEIALRRLIEECAKSPAMKKYILDSA